MDFQADYIERFSFLVPERQIEHPLYRYRKDNKNLINEIENDHIYLASIEDLNDPFDSSFAMSFDEALQQSKTFEYYFMHCFFLRYEKWFSALESIVNPLLDQHITLEDFSDTLAKQIHDVGGYYPASSIADLIYTFSSSITPSRFIGGRLACFSETRDSIPMWSYYAENHSGVCLKYDFNLLDNNNFSHQTILESLHKVWYSQNRPIDAAGTFSPFVKGLQWAHEQEWRLFKKFGSEYISMPCLTEIYLGVKYNYDSWDTIIDAVNKLPREIKIFKLKPKPDTYGFQQIRINY